jgi:hypothetical protein
VFKKVIKSFIQPAPGKYFPVQTSLSVTNALLLYGFSKSSILIGWQAVRKNPYPDRRLSGGKFLLCKQKKILLFNFPIDLSPFEWNFDLDKSGQKFHHSLKEHHKIINIPKFRCEML